MRNFIFLFFLLVNFSAWAQQFPEYCATEVKTARILKTGEDFGWPICNLGESLQLTFDVLDDNNSQLTYRIFHCDAFFNIDDLDFSDYAEGFDNLPLDDYGSSFNTYQKYSHYSLVIPNDNIKLTISGNYIVKIYDDNQNVILSKVFMVAENTKNFDVNATIKKPLSAELSFDSQQVEVSIDNSRARIANPDKNIMVFAMQNSNFFTRKRLEISYLSPNEILYSKNYGANIFYGGAEFLKFDAKDVNFTALGVDKIVLQNGLYNYHLSVNEPVSLSYSFAVDLNGSYYIKNDKGFDSNLESDYVNVWFSLKYDRFLDGNLYVVGDFTNYLLVDDYKLNFNSKTMLYETQQLVKQGLYNYQYVVLLNDGSVVFPNGSWRRPAPCRERSRIGSNPASRRRALEGPSRTGSRTPVA